MTKRKFAEKLINIKDITEQLVPISISSVDYITSSGIVYCDCGNNMYYKKSNFINKHNKYVYVSIRLKNGKQVQRRVHRLIATAFIDNPNNYDIVMHIDNNKQNNNISNLKWGTISMNTKQAFADKLIVNDKSFNDSQSINVVQLNLNKELINTFGSISEAERVTGITKAAISYQCKHKVKTIDRKPKCNCYFRFLSEYNKYGFVL